MYLKPTVGEETCFSHSGKSCWEPSRREAWPRHQTSMPRPATMSLPSSPGVEEEKIQSHLRSLRKVLAEFLDWRASEEKRRLDYLETSGAERRRIGAEFERLRRFLAEKERAVLGRLAELDAAFEAAQVEKSSRVAEGIVRLHGLIGQLEAQDIGSVLSRYVAVGCFPPCYKHPTSAVSLPSWSEMRLHLPSGLPAELHKSLSSCHRQRDALREALEQFRGILGRDSGIWGRIQRDLGKEKACSRDGSSTAPRSAPRLLPDMGRPETKPGAGNSPSAEGKGEAAFLLSLYSCPLNGPGLPPLTHPSFPAAKASPEPGAGPLPQLLADRRSVRWCEEEPAGAREHRRGQEPAGGYGGGAAPGRCRTRTR
ncbi:uncharacterized protein LOC129198334 isoform X2 [Grus americana]|uniref:uncharacterized protein LOC129198334 isoform X2 n=1 Tax=Grus americana TaxID=9117 RepID=UPI002407F9EB|nr:uncharacterized protein LOC129198334 isoform X2 [Grus americana]